MIIAIGGGEVRHNETYEIDKFIVKAARKDKPNLLFIPTASKDAQPYVNTIASLYGSLGCKVDSLLLCADTMTMPEAKSKIEAADIIYVGGGDTEFMMKKWRELQVDKFLRAAYQQNKVLAGLSAGSICWFIAGYGFVADEEKLEHKWVKGLGLIPYLHCPHYDEENGKHFDDFYSGQITDAIALDNQVAMVWDNNALRIIKANPHKHAYALTWSPSGLEKTVIGKKP